MKMNVQSAFRLLAFGFLLSVIPAVLSSPSAAQMDIGISVRIGPPALPVYEQPICPGEGYLWTPGYWAWSDDDGYYWVPGTWVEAPTPGLLWTPGYWGWNDGVYAWNGGYWGPQIGFYGGVNYGFGYGGNGFEGGEWREGHFFYNRSVTNVNVTNITNVYNKTVIVNNNHVAFNGGQGGVAARPTPQQETYAHETHTPPVAAQVQQVHAASQNRALFASANHGRPAVAATAKPGEFSGRGIVPAKAAGGTYHAPAMSPKEARAAVPAGNRAAENHGAENRPATENGAKAANRPVKASENRAVKPSAKPSSHAAAPTKENAPRSENAPSASKPRAESTPEESSPREKAPKASAPKESTPKEAAPRTEPKARENAPKASEPRESAPKANSKPSPAPKAAKPAPAPKAAAAPKHESTPKESASNASPKPSPAPRAAKPAPAPKPAAQPKQNPSKEEHKEH